MPSDLENRFHDAMVNIYKRAKTETGYNARVFLGMVVGSGRPVHRALPLARAEGV